MKLIHTADIHLGTKNSGKFPKETADKIKEDLRRSFSETAEYARKNGIPAILLCGDVFDSDTPFKKDKEFFYGVVRAFSDIKVFYLKGNHDFGGENDEKPENLYTFSSEWTTYDLGGIKISGAEISGENRSSIYSSLNLGEEDFNVVMLHGQVGSNGKDGINLTKLRDKYIDYLALGHVHSYSAGKLDERGIYAYSGCLSGRGYDETGKKGFVVLDTDGKKAKAEFVPFAKREIIETDVDVSGIKDGYEAETRVEQAIKFSSADVYRINLTGKISADVEDFAEDVRSRFADKCLYLSVKDKTEREADYSAYKYDKTLRGEFIRTVLGSDYAEEDKIRIITYGLKALKGEGAE